MNDPRNVEMTYLNRRSVLKTAGAAMVAGFAASATFAASAVARVPRANGAAEQNSGPLGERLQGVQHFGLTVQNMDRAFAFYTEVLGGTEIMRDGDFHGERIHNTLLTDQEIAQRGQIWEESWDGLEDWLGPIGRAA